MRHTLDAVGPPAPALTLAKAASASKGWMVVPMSRRDAEWPAPALAQVIAKPVLSTSVDFDACAVSLASPDRRPVLRTEAGSVAADQVVQALGGPEHRHFTGAPLAVSL